MSSDAYKEIGLGWFSAGIDVSLMWSSFAASRFREGSGATLPESISPLMREIGYGKPFCRTVFDYAKLDLKATFKELYQGSGTYYATTYMWLVGSEFAVNKIMTDRGYSQTSATFAAAGFGAIIATPGEHQMVHGRTVGTIFKNGLMQSLKQTRGFVPTFGREIISASILVSGIQVTASKACATKLGKTENTLFTDVVGSAICSPGLVLTQAPSRIAATMQTSGLGFFAVNKKLTRAAKAEVEKLPQKANMLTRLNTFMTTAYFPAGRLRAMSLMGTGFIYGMIRNKYEETFGEEVSETPSPKSP